MVDKKNEADAGADTVMTSSADTATTALLDGLIDYAGLFPPADLPLDAVVKNYSSYLACDESWILGRVIIPVGMLDEFAALAPLPQDKDDEPWCVNALVSAAGDEMLSADLDRVAAFNQEHLDPERGLCVIDVVDLKAADAMAIDSALDLMPEDLLPFFELPIGSDIRGHVAALSGTMAAAKVRTGGIVPEAYPSPEHVADFVLACVRADVPFKATAGLHHALRHRNDTVGADEFGFLNVFLGAALVRACRLDHEELMQVLVEESPTAFLFEEGSVRWKSYEVTADELLQTRIEGAISYGSCSFDEPLADLRDLRVLI